jgi:hypothetical protein
LGTKEGSDAQGRATGPQTSWIRLASPANEMTAKSKLSHLEGKEEVVLGALARLRTRTLAGTQEGKAPRWLATLLFNDLETAIKAAKLPDPRSRFELTQAWYDTLRLSQASDDSNKLWNLAYKNVDDAIRTLAERLAKASDKTAAVPKSGPSSGFAEGVAEFLVGKIAWALRISGPLHDPSTDDKRENIRLLPEIADQRKDSKPVRMPLLRRVALSTGIRRVSPLARTLATLAFLLLAAACTYAFFNSVSRIPTAAAAKLDIVTTGDVHLRYRGFQREGTSPVCGCDVEVDPNKWWGISSLARDVSLFRSGGPPYTKYVLSGPGPSDGIDWQPGLFKTTARIFILKKPFGGEGFDPRFLSSGKIPGGYEIVTTEEVEEAVIYFITKEPLHVHLFSKVPVFAMLPIEDSELTVHRSIGMYASEASRVILTEHYKRWNIPSNGELVDDGRYEFPIVDFVGPDVVFWSEHPADIVTAHKAYHYPVDGGDYLIGIYVTKPPFTSRVGVMPLTVSQRNEDVTTLGTQTKTGFITEPGTFQIEIPNPVDQMHDYSQIYAYVKAHPKLPVDHIPMMYHTFEAVNGPPDLPKAELPNDYKFKNEFGYPPIPPMAGFNIFGPLLSLKTDSAHGSVSAEHGESAIRVNDGSAVELRNISQINPDRGILTSPADSKDTMHVNLRATGDVFVNGKENSLLPWTRRLSGAGLAYVVGAVCSLLFAVLLMLSRFRRPRTS